jgi:carbonic anhydrase/acetyltransferase-like protein (isoleucine patch superfamily)
MGGVCPYRGAHPKIAASAFVAPSADVIGDVVVADEASVWFGAVLRGDLSRIEVGARTSVQDNAVIHCDGGLPSVVGADVTIGHGAVLEGCVIGDGVLIGMGAIVLQGARIATNAVIAAGSVVQEGQQIPARVLAAGVPAVVKKPLAGRSATWSAGGSETYRRLAAEYARAIATEQSESSRDEEKS